MGDVTKITLDYLTELKREVNVVLTDIRQNSDVAMLAEWSPVALGDPAAWSPSASSGGSGGGTGGSASYRVLPGSLDFVPAATLQQRAAEYAGSVITSVNWLMDAFQSLSDNIDRTLSEFATNEHNAEIDAQKLYEQLQSTFADLGGLPAAPPTISL